MRVTGPLTLGPASYDRQGGGVVYQWIRVGDDHLETVRAAGVLASLLRVGQVCTVWVARLQLPTPVPFVQAQTCFVYALEIDGRIHKAIKETRREWAWMKWGSVALYFGGGTAALLIYVGIFLWIAGFRLCFMELPISEMRRDPS